MAARYFVGGGTGNWNSTTNWSASDGGASGASFPIAGDDVFLTAASGVNTLTVNTASACTSITCTGFTGTLAGASNLTVAGNTTLGAGMTNTYTGNLIISATSTINTNGIDIYILTTFANLVTYTLASNIKVTNTWNVNSGLVTYFSGAFTIEITGTLNANIASGSINSTSNNTIILLSGNSTFTGYSGAINTGLIFLGFTININSVTTSITNNFRLESNVTLKRTAGTVTVTTCNLGLRGSNITLDTNTIQWTSFSTASAGVTVTLLSDLNVTGSYTNGVLSTFTGSFNINVSGSLIQTGIINGTGVPATTPTIVLNGTGTWSQSAGHLSTNLTINTAGTITITGTVSFLLGTLTRIAAASVVTTGSTLFITGSTTLNTTGVSWNNVSTSGAPTLTFTSTFTVLGNFSCGNGTTTLSGAGFFMGASGNIHMVNNADTTLVLCNDLTFGGDFNGVSGVSSIEANFNNFSVTINGSLTQIGWGAIQGTSTIIMAGSGNIQMRGAMLANFNINTAGTYTFLLGGVYTAFTYGTRTFKLLSGTVVVQVPFTFNAATVQVDIPLTLLDLTLGGSTTFTGNNGFTANTLTCSTAGTIHTFKSGNTYSITQSFTSISTSNVSRVSFISGTPGVQAIFTLDPAATQNVMYTNATDIDSSAGQTIWSFQQVVSNTLNWGNLNVSNIGGGGTFTFVN